MNLYAIPPLLASLITTAMGLFVLTRELRTGAHWGFGLICLCHTAWLFCYAMVYLIGADNQSTTILSKVSYTGVIFIPVTFFHYSAWLLSNSRLKRFVPLAYLGSFIFTILLWSSGLLISGLRKYFWGFYPKAGPLHPVFLLFFSILFSIIGVALVKAALRPTSPATSRIDLGRSRLAIVAMAIGLIASVDFLPNYGIEIYPLGCFFSIFMIAIYSHAILRYQMLDIQVRITATSLLLGVYFIVLGVPFLFGWIGQSLLSGMLGRSWWLIPLGLSTVLATAGPFAYAYLRREAEKRLLKDQRRYQRTLQLAARGMTRVRNVTRLANLITRLVSRTVQITHASLFLWDPVHQRYSLRSSHGSKRLALESRYSLDTSHPLLVWLLAHQQILSEAALLRYPDPAISQELAGLEATVVIPGLLGKRLIGFLVLGPKRSGAGYSPDDLNAFATLAHEAAIALENASSYEDLLRANGQLKAASERLVLQERLAAAGQFATGMAHEIKNPLSSIKTFAEYLPEKYQDPAFREKFFRIVQSEIARINSIVQELSAFAKPAPPQLQPIHLQALLEDTLALLSNQCLKQGVDVHNTFSQNGLTIHGDPQQLKQVLLNLFLNSLEAMPHGGQLAVSTTQDSQRLRLTIADTGAGIPPEKLNQIWDPFFTTKERGMGLGLAIVKGIIERHGGQISLRSQPGHGTVAEVFLPMVSSS